MLIWLSENMGTIVIGLMVLAVAALAARSVYRTKKQGECSCGCTGCSRANCHDTFE